MDTIESGLLSQLAENKKISARLANELSSYRLNRAKEIRAKYFKERKTQTDIAAEMGMVQGSVSRIISGFTCVDINEQLTTR